MLSHLTPEEVHAILKSLSDLYVIEGKGYGDLNITLEHESDEGNGQTTTITGFVVTLGSNAVTLGVGAPKVNHVEVPLSGVVRVTIER